MDCLLFIVNEKQICGKDGFVSNDAYPIPICFYIKYTEIGLPYFESRKYCSSLKASLINSNFLTYWGYLLMNNVFGSFSAELRGESVWLGTTYIKLFVHLCLY